LTETFCELRPTAVLSGKSTAVPGDSPRNWVKLRVASGNSETARESTTRPSCGPAVWMNDAALTVTDS